MGIGIACHYRLLAYFSVTKKIPRLTALTVRRFSLTISSEPATEHISFLDDETVRSAESSISAPKRSTAVLEVSCALVHIQNHGLTCEQHLRMSSQE